MDALTIVLIVTIVLVVAAIAILLSLRSRRRRQATTQMGLPSLGALDSANLDKKTSGTDSASTASPTGEDAARTERHSR